MKQEKHVPTAKELKSLGWYRFLKVFFWIVVIGGIILVILFNLPIANNDSSNESANNCKVIGSPISISAFKEKFRYIDAEAQDLRDQKKSGKVSNLKYVQEIDRIRTSAPRGYVWIDANVYAFQEELNKYGFMMLSRLPDPAGEASLAGVFAYLDLSSFPQLNKDSFNIDDPMRVLVTNLDNATPELSWFYYSVVSIEWNGGILTGAEYCS